MGLDIQWSIALWRPEAGDFRRGCRHPLAKNEARDGVESGMVFEWNGMPTSGVYDDISTRYLGEMSQRETIVQYVIVTRKYQEGSLREQSGVAELTIDFQCSSGWTTDQSSLDVVLFGADKTLQLLAQSGARSVQLICPGFSADCLETLEEIEVENRDYFLEAGGRRYEYIPCPNARSDHIQMLVSLVHEAMQD